MTLGVFLGTLAGLVHITAYVLYNRGILKGKCKPNNTTWTLWIFLALLNSSSYLKMSQDIIKSILPITSAAFRFITFGLIIAKGKWKKLDKIDYIVLTIGITAGIMWYILKSATYANLILQLAYITSIIPTYRSIWKNKSRENYFVTVQVEVHKVNPYEILWIGKKKFTKKGQEETFIRFTLDKQGNIVGSFNFRKKRFVKPKQMGQVQAQHAPEYAFFSTAEDHETETNISDLGGEP